MSDSVQRPARTRPAPIGSSNALPVAVSRAFRSAMALPIAKTTDEDSDICREFRAILTGNGINCLISVAPSGV